MSIKTKIITTVVCICCIISAMVVGVLAAKDQKFSINNATVSFSSNQIAFDLEYAVMGQVENGNIIKPNDYSRQSIDVTGAAKNWLLVEDDKSLNFDGSGSPIYVVINVLLHPNDIDRSVLIEFDSSSPILNTINTTNPNEKSVKVSFVEIPQKWRDTSLSGSSDYSDVWNFIEKKEHSCDFDLSKYGEDSLGLNANALQWKTLSDQNRPEGLKETNGLDNKEGKNGKYTLILKIEPYDVGKNFIDQNIGFNLQFTGA